MYKLDPTALANKVRTIATRVDVISKTVIVLSAVSHRDVCGLSSLLSEKSLTVWQCGLPRSFLCWSSAGLFSYFPLAFHIFQGHGAASYLSAAAIWRLQHRHTDTDTHTSTTRPRLLLCTLAHLNLLAPFRSSCVTLGACIIHPASALIARRHTLGGIFFIFLAHTVSERSPTFLTFCFEYFLFPGAA